VKPTRKKPQEVDFLRTQKEVLARALFLGCTVFLVTTILTFLLPGYKVNQDVSLFTQSFLWLTSDLLGIPLSQIVSGYPKIVWAMFYQSTWLT